VLILAAGQGTRLQPLTTNTPKALLRVHEKPILEYILEGLTNAGFSEYYFIVGFKKDQIIEYFGDGSNYSINIQYIEQSELGGTGDAVNLVQDIAEFRDIPSFVVSYGDILCSYSTYYELKKHSDQSGDLALVVNYIGDPWAGAAVYFQDETVTNIIEKPKKGTSTTQWNNSGLYILTHDVFNWLEATPISLRGELELTQAIRLGIQHGAGFHVIKIPKSGFWCDVGTLKVYSALNQQEDWKARLLDISC